MILRLNKNLYDKEEEDDDLNERTNFVVKY